MTWQRTWLRSSAGFLLAAMLTGCGQSAENEEAAAQMGPEPTHHSFGLAEIRSVDVYADAGKLHVLVAGAKKPDGTPVLRYVQSADGGQTFSEPVALGADQPPPERANRGDDVQIAADGDRLVALWQVAGNGFAGAGPMVTALSGNGGESWQAGPNPAADDTRKGHGFSDLLADTQGRFHLVWLDSRGIVETADGGKRVAAKSAGKQGLMYARSETSGRAWAGHTRIDGATCECCWNSLREGADGQLYVLYRDIAPRDMALAVSPDAGETWRKRGALAGFGWDFDGCPHVGGGLAATGKEGNLAATLWTGQAEDAGLYALTSRDGGKDWSDPAPLGEDARHSDVALMAGGSTLAVWDAPAEDGTAVFLARKPADGTRWSAPRKLSQTGERASHPRVVALGNGSAAIVWTVTPENAGRQVAITRVQELARGASRGFQSNPETG